MNWLDDEALRFMQTLNDIEEGKCRTRAGLFEVPSEKFKP